MLKLPFYDADPAHQDFQYLEDISTAYWFSEVLFSAIQLKIFELIEKGNSNSDDLAKAANCHPQKLQRLLMVLQSMELLHQVDGKWFNSQVACMFLVPEKSSYMGDFLSYRQYMQPQWQRIVPKISLDKESENDDPKDDDPENDDYALRTFQYVRAADQLIKEKSKEIAKVIMPNSWEPPFLDVGGGAGSLGRALAVKRLEKCGNNEKGGEKQGILFDLPEVISAAKKIYPNKKSWEVIKAVEGDFRNHEFREKERFGLIVISNFLHAYGENDARGLLKKTLSLLTRDGIAIIHDYFPDRKTRSFPKGPLYDLNMMLNTYDGMCHNSFDVKKWLEKEGMGWIRTCDLNTDTSIILAASKQPKYEPLVASDNQTYLEDWVYRARNEGFHGAALLPVEKIKTGSWVREKCKCGCSMYGKNLQCPPHSMNKKELEEMLNSYKWALLLEDTPPGQAFHKKLLSMEKKAFLAGFHKAFVFGAGPCPVCEKCPKDSTCRYPDKARPSMEGSGIDVYITAFQAGINLKPVTKKDRYVKYIGLLLLE